MLNSSQDLEHSDPNQTNLKSKIIPNIQEIEQMMNNQRLTDLNNSSHYSNQANNQIKTQNPQSNSMPNYLPKPNVSSINQMSHLSYLPNINQQPVNQQPINQQPVNQQSINPQMFRVPNINKYLNPDYENLKINQLIDSQSINNPIYIQAPIKPQIQVPIKPNIQSQIIPQIQSNLQLSNQQQNLYQQQNNQKMQVLQQLSQHQQQLKQRQLIKDNQFPSKLGNQQLSHHQLSNRLPTHDLISPNINGLPEVAIRKQTSPSSFQSNIYANSSIHSRYCPTPADIASSKIDNNSKYDQYSNYGPAYKETNIDSVQTSSKYSPLNETSSKYCPSTDLNSLYDPVYYRTNSQLSFNSMKDDSTIYSGYAPSIRSASTAAGSRQPINAFSNNDLDNNLVYDCSDDKLQKAVNKLTNKPRIEVIDQLENDKEVDYLTNLLVKGIESSTEPDYFGMCYNCGKTIFGEGCTFSDKLFHFDCFKCHICDKQLRGMTFYSIEGKAYCEQDYVNTLEKCFVCNKPILKKLLRASGHCYHPSCFICIECGKCLEGIHFTVDYQNKLYCIEDFHEKFAPRCSKCKKPIMPENGEIETVRIVHADNCYHVTCYRCQDCNILLSSENGKGCYPLDDLILCKACNNLRFQKYLVNSKYA